MQATEKRSIGTVIILNTVYVLTKLAITLSGMFVIVLMVMWFPDFIAWFIAHREALPQQSGFTALVFTVFLDLIPSWFFLFGLVVGGCILMYGLKWAPKKKAPAKPALEGGESTEIKSVADYVKLDQNINKEN